MIYIKENSGSINIPKHTHSSGIYKLLLSSNVTNEIVLVDNENNISTNDLYYKFSINPEGIEPGEYTYKLYSDDVVVEVGLLTFGTYNRSKVEYNPLTNKIQYNG